MQHSSYMTASIAVAAALRLRGIAPSSLGSDGTGRVLFVYRRTDELTATLDDYYDGLMTVPARAFATAMHEVRQEYLPPR